MAGASGLVGTALVAELASRSAAYTQLVRPSSPTSPSQRNWDPARRVLDQTILSGADAVVCLSGENVAERRWTSQRKLVLRTSRIDSAGLIARTLAQMASPPPVFVCASAVGYYGSKRGAEILGETSHPGNDFLAQLCADWEATTKPASDAGVRVVNLRFAVVLDPAGGALAKMLPAFRLGLGGPIGDASNFFSWLTLDEAVRMILFAIEAPGLRGPVNAAAPTPVTTREFARSLGKAVRRPAILPLPAFAIWVLLGEMGDALLLASNRVVPEKLAAAGYDFRDPELGAALRRVLGGK